MTTADQLPPSAKFVLDVVERQAPITRQELLAETTLPESTLDRALRSLKNDDYVTVTRENRDLRQVVIKMAGE